MTTAEDRRGATHITVDEPAASGRRARARWAPVSAQMGAVLLGFAAGFNLLGNLAFHTLVARNSTVATYGVTSLFLSFGILAGVLSSGFQYATARHVVHGGTTLHAEWRKVVPWLGLLVPLGALVVAYPSVGDFVHVHDPAALALTVAYLAVTIAQAVPFGLLTGGRHFRSLAAVVFIGVTIRLILFPLLAEGHQTTVTALLSSDLSTLGATVVALVLVVRLGPAHVPAHLAPGVADGRGEAATARYGTEGIAGAVLGTGLWSAWILSFVFARHYLGATEAGLFSVAHVAAGAILFMAAPIATAYMPSVASSRRSSRPVVVGLAFTAVICAGAVIGLAFLGRPIVSLLYGGAYPPPTSLLAAQGISASLVALATFLLWSSRSQQVRLLVHRRVFYVAVPLALVLEVVLGSMWHGGTVALALGPGIAVLAGMAGGAIADLVWGGERLAAA